MKNKQLYIKDGVISDCAVIELEGRWISNPTVEMIHAAGWAEYTPEPHVRTIEVAIEEKINEINAYDTSTAVNEFFINEDSLWLDKATRGALKDRIEIEEADGKTSTTLGYNGKSYVMPVATAKAMRVELERYAMAAFDTTNSHIAAVNGLTTIADVDAFDITAGYPNKLHFEV